MNSNSNNEAKELFLKYGCSHFHMARDAQYEKYKTFNVTKEQEALWVLEYQNEKMAKIQIENSADRFTMYISSLCDSIEHNNNINAFKLLLEFLKNSRVFSDSFTKLRVSEQISKTVDKLRSSNAVEQSIIEEGRLYSYALAKSVIDNEIKVDSSYPHSGHWETVLSDEKIVERANRVLNFLSK